MSDTLSDFYTGKTIFLTGAAGFIGTCILETLLRCFPEIVRVYILIRPKNGVQPEERKKEIFEKRIFKSMTVNNPELIKKVQVVSGDVSLPNFGMNEEDLKKVCDEVTIVMHGAAIINFSKPYRAICLQNTKAVVYALDICRKLKNLDVLVFTSTCYSNCHVFPEPIGEKIYPLPFKSQRFLDEMDHGTDESFAQLVASTNLKWFNSYCFSKCLSENILQEKAADLPVVIVRPSITIMTWKGQLPGYLEPGTAYYDLFAGLGRGFIKVMHCDPESTFDIIPADIVVNSHIISAWSVATGRNPSIMVVNCTSGNTLKFKFKHNMKILDTLKKEHPFPKSFQEIGATLTKSKLMYTILSLYEHYIPAFFLDIYLRFTGNRLRLMKMYRFFDKSMLFLYPFISYTADFQNDNFHDLSKQLSTSERDIFYTDFTATVSDVMLNLPGKTDMYDWKFDKLGPKKRSLVTEQRTMVITFIKRLTLLSFIYLLYLLISKVFS